MLLFNQDHLQQAAQNHVHMVYECLQGGALYKFFGQLVPVLGHHYSEKAFPDVQTASSMFQFVLIASCPVTGYL